jgi:azurin
MRALVTLTIIPLTALTLGAAALAQTAQQQSTCGVETWSTDKMTYVTIPCTDSQQVGQAPAKGANAKCGVETWSTDKMTYETTPCSAGTTEENPGGTR